MSISDVLDDLEAVTQRDEFAKDFEINIDLGSDATVSMIWSASDKSEEDFLDEDGEVLEEYKEGFDQNSGFPVEGEEWDEAVKAYIDNRFQDFESEFYNKAEYEDGKLFVYRCITVESLPRFLYFLEKGKPIPSKEKYKGIGIYWSWDKKAAECHWGKGQKSTVTVTALVDLKDIDYEATALANLHPFLGEDEKEIQIIEGREVTVVQVEDKEHGSVFEGEQAIKASLVVAALRRILE